MRFVIVSDRITHEICLRSFVELWAAKQCGSYIFIRQTGLNLIYVQNQIDSIDIFICLIILCISLTDSKTSW